jgi:hypothetical protein
VPAEKKEKRVDWKRELAEMQGPTRTILEAGTRRSQGNPQMGLLGGGTGKGNYLEEMDANMKKRPLIQALLARRKRAGGLGGLFGSGRGH